MLPFILAFTTQVKPVTGKAVWSNGWQSPSTEQCSPLCIWNFAVGIAVRQQRWGLKSCEFKTLEMDSCCFNWEAEREAKFLLGYFWRKFSRRTEWKHSAKKERHTRRRNLISWSSWYSSVSQSFGWSRPCLTGATHMTEQMQVSVSSCSFTSLCVTPIRLDRTSSGSALQV